MPLTVMPTPREIFESAREEILRQHTVLRPHLLGAVAAGHAAAGGGAHPGTLPSLIILLLAELQSHMGYEESVLLPIFRANGVSGPGQASAVQSDHARQRDEFTALLQLARTADDPPGLAFALASLVDDVLDDMAQEEVHLAGLTIADQLPDAQPR
jgi:iron-sulfur cluster repair protein YtfE (RIC family)